MLMLACKFSSNYFCVFCYPFTFIFSGMLDNYRKQVVDLVKVLHDRNNDGDQGEDDQDGINSRRRFKRSDDDSAQSL